RGAPRPAEGRTEEQGPGFTVTEADHGGLAPKLRGVTKPAALKRNALASRRRSKVGVTSQSPTPTPPALPPSRPTLPPHARREGESGLRRLRTPDVRRRPELHPGAPA